MTSQPYSGQPPSMDMAGLQRLEGLGGIFIKQKADELEDVTGVEKENKYKVIKPVSLLILSTSRTSILGFTPTNIGSPCPVY